MKLVCIHEMNGKLTEGKSYEGSIIARGAYEFAFVAFDDSGKWSSFNIVWFEPEGIQVSLL